MSGKVDGIALQYMIDVNDWIYGTDLEEAKIVSYGDVYVVMAALEDIGLVERRMVTSPYVDTRFEPADRRPSALPGIWLT